MADREVEVAKGAVIACTALIELPITLQDEGLSGDPGTEDPANGSARDVVAVGYLKSQSILRVHDGVSERSLSILHRTILVCLADVGRVGCGLRHRRRWLDSSDTCVTLCTGASPNIRISRRGAQLARFRSAVAAVCLSRPRANGMAAIGGKSDSASNHSDASGDAKPCAAIGNKALHHFSSNATYLLPENCTFGPDYSGVMGLMPVTG